MRPRRQPESAFVSDRNDSLWLQQLLLRAVSEHWCIGNYCTTCGSYQMRAALGWAHREPGRRMIRRSVPEAEVQSIIEGLRHCRPDTEHRWEFEQAVRWVLLRIWDQFGDEAHVRLFPRLEGTWSEDVLNSMRQHYKEKLERRRLHEARHGVKQRLEKE